MKSRISPAERALSLMLLFAFFNILACAQTDNPPEISDIYADKTTAGLGEAVTITSAASDDLGISRIHFSTPENPSMILECAGTPAECDREITYAGPSEGVLQVCSRAEDSSGQFSPEKCISLQVLPDRPPEIVEFKARPNPVYKDAKANFTIEASDDLGVKKIFLEEMSTGMVSECDCAGEKTCSSRSCTCASEPCFVKEFPVKGEFRFCSWAADNMDQQSEKECMEVSVVTFSECTDIVLNDTKKDVVIATRIESKKIYEEEYGFTGYPVECCSYCMDLAVDSNTCEKIKGSMGVDADYSDNYTLRHFAPGEKISFEDLNYTSPYVICESIKEDRITVGLVDGSVFQVVDYIYNRDMRRYWFIETRQAPKQMSYLYVSNSGIDSVAKIDTTDGSIACEYKFPGIGDNPSRTAVSLNGDAWVGNRDSNDVSWLDGESCEVKARIPVGRGPRAIVVDFNGDLWVGNREDDNVWKIDGKTGRCLIGDPSVNPTCPQDKPPIQVGDGPYGGVISCNGFLYTVNRGDGTLSKIDMAGEREVWRKYIGDIYGVGIDSQSNIWLGGAYSGNVYKVSGDTGDVLCKNKVGSKYVNTCTRGVAVDEDDYAWVADSGTGGTGNVNRVYKVDQDCNLVLDIPVGDHPIGVASDFNRHMWVINRESSDAYKLGIEDGSILGKYPTSGLASPNPYCYSDMTGYGLYHTCFNRTSQAERSEDRYFFAEQLLDAREETKTSVIVDARAYSETVHSLLQKECFHKMPESIECRQYCDGAGNCLVSSLLPCPGRCFPIYNYTECVYKKYESMYGRPYADYLHCHKTPLKDTAWCRQESVLPTSNIAYPWYSFTRSSADETGLRSLAGVDGDYLNDMNKWNANVDVDEMPDLALIADKTLTPELRCSYMRDNKLFRTVWTKIFTVTPHLRDDRNNMFWTRTGEGVLYAGGGFKREPACYWNDCALCGPGGGAFTSDVVSTIRIKIPGSVIAPTFPLYSRTNYYYYRDYTSNGPLTVISTANIPFVVSSSSFAYDEHSGEYLLRLAYRPADNIRPFNLVQDIEFKYNLTEDVEKLYVEIDEECTTSLGSIETTLSVDDFLGKSVDIVQDKIVALREAAAGFVNISVDRGNKVGLVAFSGDEGSTISPPQCVSNCIISSMDLTDDAGALYKQINQTYKPAKWTCIACGIDLAREMFQHQAFASKSMVLMSDGEENARSHITNRLAREAASLAAAEGIRIYTVALGDETDKATLKDVADITGGRFYEISCDMLLQDIYKKLAKDIGDTILVSDLSKSMEESLSLSCASNATPVVHEDILEDVRVNITGFIENTGDGLVKARGYLNITVEPDILSGFALNMGDSGIDHFSLLYPVKHELYRKETSKGVEKKTYVFEDSYGYEDPEFGYPTQCRKICPLDCTCPEDDITDVTCPDGKRNDCVCMPPQGHSYKTPCVSERTFHEEELDYYDFVDLYTMETAELRSLDTAGPTTLFTGDLSATVEHLKLSDTLSGKEKRVLFYTAGDKPWKLAALLGVEGYEVDIVGRDESGLTTELLANYTQLWFMDFAGDTELTLAEKGAVTDYYNKGGGAIFSGKNGISGGFGVDMSDTYAGVYGCVNPDVPAEHPLTDGVTGLSGGEEVDMKTSNPNVKIIATTDAGGIVRPCIMALDTAAAGRIVFDSSPDRFMRIEECGNYRYAMNTAKWLHTSGLPSGNVTGVYIINFTALSFPNPFEWENVYDSNITLYVHFRNDTEKQTFPLLPARDDGRLNINVTLLNPPGIIYSVSPRKHDLSEGTAVRIDMALLDPISNQPVAGEEIIVEAAGYDIMETLTTDAEGKASFEFQIGSSDTTVTMKHARSRAGSGESVYLSVSSLNTLWWLLSPQVLLLFLTLVLITFSYKWFREGRLDLDSIRDELRGKK
ncbi:MAG: VWA domain-containing protein [Candidatus Altiarchaeota archaeon]|nr:VWA domain-containing protein [Candidatus Altiarchaeota archaeon]